ncbi:MAG: cupredoxin family copper-binding protein, partial [Nitrososphaerales archaeon]
VGVPGWGNMQGWGGQMGPQCCGISGGERITEENALQIIEEENTIAILNYEFNPESITIKSGTTITWINLDVVSHTVNSGTHETPADLFESGFLEQREIFSYTFNEPGVYLYYCEPHPYMKGVITVEA